ncbi:hypothetical protein [Legionella fairfieldensis]|uniref:hypothetical protein n=1 Tax=Legionella fairfieldensis TaxID=45064 RepID=UPI000491BF5C|nr:hypothetical protein [Legionella fairfieldensis]
MDFSFIKRIFGSQRANTRKSTTANKQAKSNKEIVEILLSLIINDDYLSVPIYIHGINCEEQAHAFGTLYPLQYVWNEHQTDAGHLGFSFSINGAAVGSMLEGLIPRTNSNFAVIRDEVMSVLSYGGKQTLLAMVEKAILPPSQLLKNFEYEDIINLNFNR